VHLKKNDNPKGYKKKRENKGTACAGLGASLRWLSAGALC
jgi:hypothetical protein